MAIGPTKTFPCGKLDGDDEGGLRIGMMIEDKTIIIAFGTPVKWIGLDLQTAEIFAASLQMRIEELKGKIIS